MTQCDYVHEIWGPHEGCKEFMDEPETFPCTNDAATAVTTFWEGPDYPDYRFVRIISTEFFCAEHPLDDEFLGAPYGPTLISIMPIDGSEF
jgi:hypothetical protein